MKIAVIGDVHGRDRWMRVNPNEYDQVVLIGDYFDSFDLTDIQQLDNFINLLQFIVLPNVTALIGNHDAHYLWFSVESYSGFQAKHAFRFKELLRDNLNLFQMCVQFDGYLFSHAGVSTTWFNRWNEPIKDLSLVDGINQLWRDKPRAFHFGENFMNSPHGNDITQSPIWIRPQSLYTNPVENYVQVVGHTQVKEPKYYMADILLTDAPDYLTVIDTDTKTFESILYKDL